MPKPKHTPTRYALPELMPFGSRAWIVYETVGLETGVDGRLLSRKDDNLVGVARTHNAKLEHRPVPKSRKHISDFHR